MQHLCPFEDGTHLSYLPVNKFKGYRGNYTTWPYSGYTNFIHEYTSRTKSGQHKLSGLTSRGRYIMLFADFDTLPSQFELPFGVYNASAETGWDSFASYCKVEFPTGLVMRTHSGKVKVAFVCDTSMANKPDQLRSYLLDITGELYTSLDLSFPAMTIMYFDSRHAFDLNEFCRSGVITDVGEYVCDHKYKAYYGDLPDIAENWVRCGRGSTAVREKFIRIILRQLGLAKSGFDLPTTKLGSELGISFKRVSEWLRSMIQCGILKCIDESYHIGVRAKRYKVCGLLLSFMRVKFRVLLRIKKVSKDLDAILPDFIESKDWHSKVWELSKYFISCPEKFILYGKNMAGSSLYNRRSKFLHAINSRLRYAGLTTI